MQFSICIDCTNENQNHKFEKFKVLKRKIKIKNLFLKLSYDRKYEFVRMKKFFLILLLLISLLGGADAVETTGRRVEAVEATVRRPAAPNRRARAFVVLSLPKILNYHPCLVSSVLKNVAAILFRYPNVCQIIE